MTNCGLNSQINIIAEHLLMIHIVVIIISFTLRQ